MKKLLISLFALTTALNAHASMWTSLSQANRDFLITGRTKAMPDQTRAAYLRATGGRLHANELPQSGEDADTREAIFRVNTVYRLINATPAKAAGAFSDYLNFGTMFSNQGVRGCTIDEGALPNLKIVYRKATTFAGVDGRISVYRLLNEWESQNNDECTNCIKNTWTYDPGTRSYGDNNDVYHVAGVTTFEPVVQEDGTVKTLIKYVNYINPGPGNIPLMNFRWVLDSDEARSQNRTEVVGMVNRLASFVEGHGLEAQTRTICAAVAGIGAAEGCTP